MSIKITKIKNNDNTNAGDDTENLYHSHIAGGNVKRCSHSGKDWQSLKLNKSYQKTAIVLLGIYSGEKKS